MEKEVREAWKRIFNPGDISKYEVRGIDYWSKYMDKKNDLVDKNSKSQKQ